MDKKANGSSFLNTLFTNLRRCFIHVRSSTERMVGFMLTNEYSYKFLKLAEGQPEISQRELPEALCNSLAKENYYLKALKTWYIKGN